MTPFISDLANSVAGDRLLSSPLPLIMELCPDVRSFRFLQNRYSYKNIL